MHSLALLLFIIYAFSRVSAQETVKDDVGKGGVIPGEVRINRITTPIPRVCSLSARPRSSKLKCYYGTGKAAVMECDTYNNTIYEVCFYEVTKMKDTTATYGYDFKAKGCGAPANRPSDSPSSDYSACFSFIVDDDDKKPQIIRCECSFDLCNTRVWAGAAGFNSVRNKKGGAWYREILWSERHIYNGICLFITIITACCLFCTKKCSNYFMNVVRAGDELHRRKLVALIQQQNAEDEKRKDKENEKDKKAEKKNDKNEKPAAHKVHEIAYEEVQHRDVFRGWFMRFGKQKKFEEYHRDKSDKVKLMIADMEKKVEKAARKKEENEKKKPEKKSEKSTE